MKIAKNAFVYTFLCFDPTISLKEINIMFYYLYTFLCSTKAALCWIYNSAPAYPDINFSRSSMNAWGGSKQFIYASLFCWTCNFLHDNKQWQPIHNNILSLSSLSLLSGILHIWQKLLIIIPKRTIHLQARKYFIEHVISGSRKIITIIQYTSLM